MKFTPYDGKIYAHLFENPRTGLTRNLFWNINLDLAPIELNGEEWESSFACEWLVWPIRQINDLDGMSLKQVVQPKLIESSIYLAGRHHPVTVTVLQIRRQAACGYRLDVVGAADLMIDGKTINRSFSFECDLSFEGIVVVPDNLYPKPVGPSEVTAVLAPFISIEGLREPSWERFRYILDPAA